MKKFHFSGIPYKYNNKKIVMAQKDFRDIQDYIIFLEGFVHYTTGKTFCRIPEELAKYRRGEWYRQAQPAKNKKDNL